MWINGDDASYLINICGVRCSSSSITVLVAWSTPSNKFVHFTHTTKDKQTLDTGLDLDSLTKPICYD